MTLSFLFWMVLLGVCRSLVVAHILPGTESPKGRRTLEKSYQKTHPKVLTDWNRHPNTQAMMKRDTASVFWGITFTSNPPVAPLGDETFEVLNILGAKTSALFGWTLSLSWNQQTTIGHNRKAIIPEKAPVRVASQEGFIPEERHGELVHWPGKRFHLHFSL